jgi:hypothetical protein
MSECIECIHRHLLAAVALLVVGCTTQRLYDGEPPPAGQTAIVRADPVVSAGLPVQVRIRRVNGRDIGVSTSRVELPAGRHEILVDCRVAETGSVRRFTVAAVLEPGRRYRLAAETTARNCEAVQLLDD